MAVTQLDDIAYNARSLLPQVSLPALLGWERHRAMADLATGALIVQRQSHARLVVLAESGNSPCLEGPARFHQELAQFIAGLQALHTLGKPCHIPITAASSRQ